MNCPFLNLKRLIVIGMFILLCSCSGRSTSGDSDSNGTVYDIASRGLPHFVETDYIETPLIQKISKFRSGIGHDYADDFESCRCMKHYFMPDTSVDWSTVRIYAPVSGTVREIKSESDGTQIWIASDDYPGFNFIIFHVNLDPPLAVGDHVAEGQQLGSHIGSQTMSDIAIGVHTPNGWKLVSYFEVLTDPLFDYYLDRGIIAREKLIISQQERDGSPLVCPNGEHGRFQDIGMLANWVELN